MLKVKEKIPTAINIIFTLVFVLVGWVLFYYVDIKDGIQHIGIMFGVVKAKLVDANAVYYFKEYMGFIVVGMLASIPWKNVIKLPKVFDKMLMWLKPIAVTALFVASLAMLVGQSYNPFLYFRF